MLTDFQDYCPYAYRLDDLCHVSRFVSNGLLTISWRLTFFSNCNRFDAEDAITLLDEICAVIDGAVIHLPSQRPIRQSFRCLYSALLGLHVESQSVQDLDFLVKVRRCYFSPDNAHCRITILTE